MRDLEKEARPGVEARRRATVAESHRPILSKTTREVMFALGALAAFLLIPWAMSALYLAGAWG